MTTMSQHPDAASLAALLEPGVFLPDQERAHVDGCQQCQATLQDYHALQGVLRAVLPVRAPRSFAIPAPEPGRTRRGGLSLVWLRTVTTLAGTAMIVFIGLDLGMAAPVNPAPLADAVTATTPELRSEFRISPAAAPEAPPGGPASGAPAPDAPLAGPAPVAAREAAPEQVAASRPAGLPIVRVLAMAAGTVMAVGALVILRERYRQSTGR